MRRPARAYLDASALRHNLSLVREYAPHSRVVAMIKADAYGHGMLEAASIVSDRVDALGVACVGEAVVLREGGVASRILVTQGFKDDAELQAAVHHGLDVVVHALYQLQLLEKGGLSRLPRVWIKVDSGMHRLGFMPDQVARVHSGLSGLPGLPTAPGFISHFACADLPENPLTATQLMRFDRALAGLPGERTLANSAAVLSLPESHRDWVRPGIMLYGSSPMASRPAGEIGLRAVMSLRAPLIAINHCPRGEGIGYGSTYVCPENMSVGIVGIGYGDGYPRHAANGTPVSVNGQRSVLVGRVSMDMLAIDLRDIQAQVGDEVELWGAEVGVDEVARSAQTISYELLCNAGSKTARIFY